MKNRVLILLVLFGIGIPNIGFSQKKIIQTAETKEELYVTVEKISPDLNSMYSWYKSNQVFESRGDYGGDLLHGPYVKYLYTNELIEKGSYEYGIKTGQWKVWYPSGKIKTFSNWKDGKLDGVYYELDSKGVITKKGKYCKGVKKGTWRVGKDTIRYKRGKVKVEKSKKIRKKKVKKGKRLKGTKKTVKGQKEKLSKLKDLKKVKSKKINKKKDKAKKIKKDKKLEKNSKKDSFFKRIFKKETPSVDAKS